MCHEASQDLIPGVEIENDGNKEYEKILVSSLGARSSWGHCPPKTIT